MSDIDTDDAPPMAVMEAVLRCAASWEGDARIIGNVRAKDIIRAIMAYQHALSRPAAQEKE